MDWYRGYTKLKNNKYLVFFDLHPFSWTEVIKQLFGNGSGILPDSFLYHPGYGHVIDRIQYPANHITGLICTGPDITTGLGRC